MRFSILLDNLDSRHFVGELFEFEVKLEAVRPEAFEARLEVLQEILGIK